jgi:hypothetical protein
MKDIMSIQKEGKGLEVTKQIHAALVQCLGSMDKILPPEVMNSPECSEWFYNAAMQLFITMGRDILKLSKDKLVEHLKIVLDASDGTNQNKETN